MQTFVNVEDWIEKKWGKQSSLGDALGVAANTISQWVNGKSRISFSHQKKMRELGYDGPFPDSLKEVTREDIELLRQEVRTMAGWVREESRKEIVTLAAILQQVLKDGIAQESALEKALKILERIEKRL